MLESKADNNDVLNEFDYYKKRVDNFYLEINGRLNRTISEEDFFLLKKEIESKANYNEMNEILALKANNSNVTNALSSKVSHKEVEMLLKEFVDFSQFDQITRRLEEMANFSEVKAVYDILENKSSKDEFIRLSSEVATKCPINNVHF